ncbi:MAG: hypothetical protein AABY22_29750 [Nanoarchaeota archaeon]
MNQEMREILNWLWQTPCHKLIKEISEYERRNKISNDFFHKMEYDWL